MEQSSRRSANFKRLWIWCLPTGLILVALPIALRGFIPAPDFVFELSMILGAAALAFGFLVVFLWLASLIAGIAVSKGRTWTPFFVMSLFFPLVMWIIVSVITTDQATATKGTRVCPFCAERIREEAVLCRFCGREIQAGEVIAHKQEPKNHIPKPDSHQVEENHPRTSQRFSVLGYVRQVPWAIFLQKRNLIIAATLVLATGASFAYAGFSDLQVKERVRAEQEERKKERAFLDAKLAEEQARILADNSWVPSGYRKFEVNPSFAWKKDSRECQSSGVCLPMSVVTNQSCSTISVRGLLENGAYAGDYASDFALNVSAGQKVQMKLQFASETNGSVKFTQVSCY